MKDILIVIGVMVGVGFVYTFAYALCVVSKRSSQGEDKPNEQEITK